MTADEKKIQDLCMEIDKLKAELAKSKKELEESKELLGSTLKIRSIMAQSVALFIEHPEMFEFRENR